jgi:uncharacterized surface protein with fasciclin (FAS1) repeats
MDKQNVAIIAGVAVLLIAGVIYFTSAPSTDLAMEDEVEMNTDESQMTDEAMDMDMDEASADGPDIVDAAVGTPSLSTLVAAVTAAELVATLQSEGPFTVFAPTNAAFAALPDGTLETLLDPANLAQLQGILTYHVVPGAVMAGDLTDGMVVETVNGESITINVSDAGVSINGSAMVTAADVVTSNGVVHIIDAVLLPPAE